MGKPSHRPEIEINMTQLATLMRFKPTQADAAAYFKCSEDTIARRIEKETGLSYAEFREQNMVHTRMTLIQTALTKATKGDNVMLIFCLKNLCSWKNEGPDEELDKLKSELADLLKQLSELKSRAA